MLTLGLLINLAYKMDKKCKVFQKNILCEAPYPSMLWKKFVVEDKTVG